MLVLPTTGHASSSSSAPASTKKKKKALAGKKTVAPIATVGLSTLKPTRKKKDTLPKNSTTKG